MAASRKAWEAENLVELVDPQRDALYGPPSAADAHTLSTQPWRKDPHHFKHVRISAVALLKMVMHARSGGSIEIMGLMQGKISGDAFIVTDAFRLPVEGTETRVNAGAEADEYQVQYLHLCRENNVPENAIGWYHSHPGYGCWLSGIDVATHQQQQAFLDPYLAIVIDPDRTISAGKVEIGAFRTFPKDYKPPAGGEDDEYQSIPLAKIEDFGAHASQYYSLDVSHYKSTLDTQLLDLLWNKYWASTLSQSPLFSNRDYGTRRILDLSQKIQNTRKALPSSARAYRSISSKDHDKQMEKLVKDGNKIAGEEMTGLMAAEIKGRLFSGVGAAES